MYTVPKLHSKTRSYLFLLSFSHDFVSSKELEKPSPLLPGGHAFRGVYFCWLCASSVYFHCGIDFPDKHVGCIEANGASEEPEGQDHKGGVAEV